AREREADHRYDGSGHHRGQQVADRVDADEMDDHPDGEVDDAGHDDAGVREAVVAGGALHGKHRTDERKARAKIARYLETGDDEEDERRHAAEEDDGVRAEPQDEWH